MQIELWSLDRIKPYPNNPRINDDAVDAVAASLREFGWRQPIVVDRDAVIIVGQTVSECMIDEDIESGAPVNANGTLNLVHYAAWLIKEMAHGD